MVKKKPLPLKFTQNMIIEFIKKSKEEGLTIDELMTKMKLNKKILYNYICLINKHEKGIKIINDGHRYKINQKFHIDDSPLSPQYSEAIKPLKENSNSEQSYSDKIPENTNIIPFKPSKDDLNCLSPEEQKEYFSLLSKAYYYKKSASALIESKNINKILQEVII